MWTPIINHHHATFHWFCDGLYCCILFFHLLHICTLVMLSCFPCGWQMDVWVLLLQYIQMQGQETLQGRYRAGIAPDHNPILVLYSQHVIIPHCCLWQGCQNTIKLQQVFLRSNGVKSCCTPHDCLCSVGALTSLDSLDSLHPNKCGGEGQEQAHYWN